MSKRDILIKKYFKLNEDLSQFMDCSFLPSLMDVDFEDVILYFKYTFDGLRESDYKDCIISLLYIHNIDSVNIELIYPLLYDFIIFFKKIIL